MNPEKRKQTLIEKFGTWEAYKQHQAKHGRAGGKKGGGKHGFGGGKVNPKLAGEKGRSVRDAKNK